MWPAAQPSLANAMLSRNDMGQFQTWSVKNHLSWTPLTPSPQANESTDAEDRAQSAI